MKKLMIAAPRSGSGKTLITCGLLRLLLRKGFHPAAFKCGPDFIDPMFHRRVLGIPGTNLGSYFLGEEDVRALFRRTIRRENADFALIEGVMGYYDGIAVRGGLSTKAGSYDIARITGTPVLLIVDGRGSALSAAAEVLGFQKFRPDSRIAGVLLNRIKPAAGKAAGTEIERLCGIPVVGCVPEDPAFVLESRHLGLVLPGEVPGLLRQVDLLEDRLETCIDFPKLLAVAGEEDMEKAGIASRTPGMQDQEPGSRKAGRGKAAVRIAVAMDEAFSFYYPENLGLLREMGAEIFPFSPLRDQALPDGCSGILLGGGYPELYTEEIAGNLPMRRALRRAADRGMPWIAECGGFLALHRELEGADGVLREGFGIYPENARRTDHLSRFGYAEYTARGGLRIRGHEFHYWESSNPGSCWTAEKPSGRTWPCMHDSGRGQIAGFPHLYWLSCPEFLENWLSFCESCQRAWTNGETGLK